MIIAEKLNPAPAAAATGYVDPSADVTAFSSAGTVSSFVRRKAAAAAFQEQDRDDHCNEDSGFHS